MGRSGSKRRSAIILTSVGLLMAGSIAFWFTGTAGYIVAAVRNDLRYEMYRGHALKYERMYCMKLFGCPWELALIRIGEKVPSEPLDSPLYLRFPDGEVVASADLRRGSPLGTDVALVDQDFEQCEFSFGEDDRVTRVLLESGSQGHGCAVGVGPSPGGPWLNLPATKGEVDRVLGTSLGAPIEVIETKSGAYGH